MTIVTRRGFLASAAVASALAGSGGAMAARTGGALLLHDPGLGAGQRFAARAGALGAASLALEGDRVRQVRGLLTDEPSALFGITRRSDELLIGEIAAEAGYRRVALVLHRAVGVMVPICAPDGATIGTLARLAGTRWPEAFAELALGGIEQCEVVLATGAAEPALSWVLVRSR
ncbi:hypothetical protein KRZ98_12050 [Sphingobium sp. AS12]|uniref:hypothetical protein n=1 Tax=Sphingobium sp. AS12 TaxID=2849495 RepID=UPI001C312284|nr:hypothetical protein [Sphingobium sp. AS12]MBV2149014.1 hypothetical protein [Sphingobium sp. AS12]